MNHKRIKENMNRKKKERVRGGTRLKREEGRRN